MAQCEYLHCLKDAEIIRTVDGPKGHSWTTSLCETHARGLDAGLPMAIYVYANRAGVPAA